MSSLVPSGEEIFTPEFIQTRMTVFMAKGLRIVPFLNQDRVPSMSNYTYFYEDQTAEADITDGTMAEAQRVAPGAELIPVRSSELSSNSLPVEIRGYKLKVENSKLQQNGQSVMRFIERLAYGLGRSVEEDAYTQLAAKAAASTATLVDGNWDDSTGVGQDVIRMQEAFQDDSLPDELNAIFYESVNHRELREYLDANNDQDVIYNNQNDLSYKGARHIYGGKNMVHGTALGFDLRTPPATVAFGVVEGASSPSVLEGMEGYAPIINVKVSESDELYKSTIIEMAVETAVAVENAAALLKQTGL